MAVRGSEVIKEGRVQVGEHRYTLGQKEGRLSLAKSVVNPRAGPGTERKHPTEINTLVREAKKRPGRRAKEDVVERREAVQ